MSEKMLKSPKLPERVPTLNAETMYMTFFDSPAMHVGHQFTIGDYAFNDYDYSMFMKRTPVPAPKPAPSTPSDPIASAMTALSEEASTMRKLTINRKRENLRPFFNSHFAKHGEWMILPTPPNFPISEIAKHYHSFKIPKSDGGLRQIDEPDQELKEYFKAMKSYFEYTLRILPSEAAHAYISGRTVKTALQVHQKAEVQNWFLKLDFHAFFPSHNLEYILKMFSHIYPVGYLMEDPEYYEKFKHNIEYCLLNDSLPQGSNLSPTLTNILMVPIDYHIQHNLYAMDKGYIYTRYADDMLISSPYKTDYREVEKSILDLLAEIGAPFELNTKKTRYGSKAGKNWNLGLMLNKDNEITYGWKNVKRFRAMVFSICKDHQNGIEWSVQDKQHLSGIISWYSSVNKEKTVEIIREYEKKYNVSLRKLLKPPKIKM